MENEMSSSSNGDVHGKKVKDSSTNTDDTLKLIPYEVDHWASRCSRFADEFQSSRSFEDAQSAISDLDESLSRYLTLTNFDGDLRTDILLYCILCNILDGLQSNSTVFVPPDTVTSVLRQALDATGKLGRYGFQSFKQGIKTLRFLMKYYSSSSAGAVENYKRPKCLVILWQSVKKIGIQGSSMFPALYPGDQEQWLKFHGNECPSACCKSVRIDFSEKGNPVILKHCTSTHVFLSSLSVILENEDFFYNPENPLVLHGRRSDTPGKLEDLSMHSMIRCDMDVIRSTNSLISDISRSQPQYRKALDNCRRNQCGSVVLRWASRHFNSNITKKPRTDDNVHLPPQYYVLGMKQFGSEHLQSILVDCSDDSIILNDDNSSSPGVHLLEEDDETISNSMNNEATLSSIGSISSNTMGDFENSSSPKSPLGWLVIDVSGRKIAKTGKIETIHDFKWDLKFGSCPQGCWTRAEILFLDKLEIFPFLEEVSVSFEDHLCNSSSNTFVKCFDCSLLEDSNGMSTTLIVDRIYQDSVERGIRIEFKDHQQRKSSSAGDDHQQGAKGKEFSRWKFALSVPLNKREMLKKLDAEFSQRFIGKGFFHDEDFEQILRIWEQNKDYYYTGWRTAS